MSYSTLSEIGWYQKFGIYCHCVVVQVLIDGHKHHFLTIRRSVRIPVRIIHDTVLVGDHLPFYYDIIGVEVLSFGSGIVLQTFSPRERVTRRISS